jgi:septal ring factor EnvC (AmiA/AmiB activator)
VVGQLVFGGEPVGVMGQSDDGKPRLYLELRRNNRPVDPLPWLTKEEVKVSG